MKEPTVASDALLTLIVVMLCIGAFVIGFWPSSPPPLTIIVHFDQPLMLGPLK